MEGKIPQLLHIEAVFAGFEKEEFLAIILFYGLFGVLWDQAILGMVLGFLTAYYLRKWKEEKPRGAVIYRLRRYIPIENGVFNTGIDCFDRRITY
jgi:hypothetical protein